MPSDPVVRGGTLPGITSSTGRASSASSRSPSAAKSRQNRSAPTPTKLRTHSGFLVTRSARVMRLIVPYSLSPGSRSTPKSSPRNSPSSRQDTVCRAPPTNQARTKSLKFFCSPAMCDIEPAMVTDTGTSPGFVTE
jgi:hypothetical protein